MKFKVLTLALVALLAYSCNDDDLDPQPDDIYYVDYPDTTITSLHHYVQQPWGQMPSPSDTLAFVQIDVDGDGTNDFSCNADAYYQFHSASSPEANYFHSVGINALNPADSLLFMVENNDGDGQYRMKLYQGDVIDGSYNYNTHTYCYMMVYGIGLIGNIDGEGYYGFKLNRNGNVYYGWILIEHTSVTMTLKSFAINRTPGNPITAGQTE